MSRLDSALARFSAALDDLERMAQARLTSEDQLPIAQKLISDLQADKARLEAALEQLLEERDRLERVNDAVAGRLDTAIQDIRGALSTAAAE